MVKGFIKAVTRRVFGSGVKKFQRVQRGMERIQNKLYIASAQMYEEQRAFEAQAIIAKANADTIRKERERAVRVAQRYTELHS